jgi:hypothetical protein
MYPDSNIWVIGHSLGGALASLLGVTFGAPVVAFESPGEKLASSRLHLPTPVSCLMDVPLDMSFIIVCCLAVYATHYARLPYRGSDRHGCMYGNILIMWIGWIRHGDQVSRLLLKMNDLLTG